MAIARRFKPIIRIEEHHIGFVEGGLDPREPYPALARTVRDRSSDRHHLAGEDSSWEDVSRFQCPNIPLARCYDLTESVKEARVEMPPMLRLPKIADVSPVLVVALFRVEPPCNTEMISWRQSTKDTQLHIVANVTDVAVLHGQITDRSSSLTGSRCCLEAVEPLREAVSVRPIHRPLWKIDRSAVQSLQGFEHQAVAPA